jgi:putative endopeptidase
MVKNLVAALRDDLKTLPVDGRGDAREGARQAGRVRPKIGYPDVWRDYSALTIDRGALRLERPSAPPYSNAPPPLQGR